MGRALFLLIIIIFIIFLHRLLLVDIGKSTERGKETLQISPKHYNSFCSAKPANTTMPTYVIVGASRGLGVREL
jgi:hypothetical protein